MTVDSDVDVSGVVSSVGDGAQVLGVDYDCEDTDWEFVPQLARAADHKNDSPEVEGDFFTNISSDCGSSRGSSRELSYFAIEVSDTRRPSVIPGDQLNFLNTVMMNDASSCVNRSVFKKLNRKLSNALRNHSRGRFGRALNAMLDFDQILDTSADAFSCTDNTFGNVRARARQIIYQLQRELALP